VQDVSHLVVDDVCVFGVVDAAIAEDHLTLDAAVPGVVRVGGVKEDPKWLGEEAGEPKRLGSGHTTVRVVVRHRFLEARIPCRIVEDQRGLLGNRRAAVFRRDPEAAQAAASVQSLQEDRSPIGVEWIAVPCFRRGPGRDRVRVEDASVPGDRGAVAGG